MREFLKVALVGVAFVGGDESVGRWTECGARRGDLCRASRGYDLGDCGAVHCEEYGDEALYPRV